MDDEDSEYCYDNTPESYELNDTGILGESSESETDILFRNLEEELRGLMRRYSVQPSDLEQLFQVVHQMFEIMDANQEALNIAHSEKQELESLWMQAKDELKHTKKEKANRQSLLEDEQMRHESERVEYEKEKALMKTKLKQMEEYKHIVEQDLVKVKEKMAQNDQKRTEILELYKKQLDAGKTATLRRIKGGTGTLKRRTLPRHPRQAGLAYSVGGPMEASLEASVISAQFLSMTMSARTESLVASAEVPVQVTFPHDELDENDTHRLSRPSWVVQSQPRPVRSLAEELRSEGEDITSSIRPSSNGVNSCNRTNSYGRPNSNEGENEVRGNLNNEGGGDRVNEASQEEEEEEEEFFEEVLAVDPQMITEVEMLQNEKEGWEDEQRQLEQEKRILREQKDDFERQNTLLQVELKRLHDSHRELQEKLTVVKKERDEILDNYLEQPFDEYCITRKELHKLLMEQQITKMELEKAREDKYKLQQQLLSKRSIFEKFRHGLRRLLTKQNQQVVIEKKEMEQIPESLPPPMPLIRDISPVIEKGDFVIKRGWFMSQDSHVPEHKLPNWMGQITLKGVETERIECSAVARIFQSPMTGKSLNLKNHTPQQQVALLSSVQQLHVEVWTATVEGASVRMEIIDVIARPPRVRQRFVMKPKTSHIVCMASIPGEIDPSRDFTDSLTMSQDLEEATKSYQPPTRSFSSYLGPRFGNRGNRPFSAPKERAMRSNVMASTPNLNLSSASDTGPLIRQLEVPSPDLSRAVAPKKPPRKTLSTTAESTPNMGLSSSSCTMITIEEDIDGGKRTARDNGGEGGGGGGGGGLRHEERGSLGPEGKGGSEISGGKSGGGKGGEEDLDKQDLKMEDESSVSLSTSSLETDEPSKPFTLGGRSLLSDERFGYSDDDTRQSLPGKNGHRFRSFTSTPRRPGNHEGFRKLSESVRHDGLPDERREGSSKMMVEEYDYDCTDGGEVRRDTPSPPGSPSAPVMWIITEEQNLLFFPTTDPSHKPINRVKLRDQGLCMAYVPRMGEQRPRVFIGHARAKISFYCMDEFKSNVWDIDNPDEITLPSFNPNEVSDVRCITCVKDRLWVGAGQSIFFLNAENPNIREGSIFLDGSRMSPEAILKVGNVVVVSSRGSTFYVFDPDSAHELRRFNITTVARELDLPTTSPSGAVSEKPATISSTTNIKTMIADSDFLYLGTSNGKIVSVPVASLTQPSSINWNESSQENLNTEKTNSKSFVTDSESVPHVAVAVHRQMEGRVRSLLHVSLPRTKLSKLKEAAEMLHYHSLPNLTSPLGGRIPISPPILSFRSLIISAGKGHVEYVAREEKGGDEEDSVQVHRERHEAFQLLVWGHKNTML